MGGTRWLERSGRLGLGACLTFGLACDDGALVLGLPPASGREVGGGEDAPEPRLPDAQHGNDASWVFDDDAVREYRLVLDPGDWEALQATALEERYFPADLSVDGAAFGRVGLRFKGSRGTLGRCADRAGNLTCSKLSMKVKFDEYADDQRFFGLKRLNFQSMLSDITELHERLAYQLFREMGIAAPRAGHARLVVNGEPLGVFGLVEQIDGRFTDDRFVGGDGNLYKEQWPITGNPTALDATLKTNEETPEHGVLAQFHSELAAAPPEGLPDLLARYMDVDELLAYVAVDRLVSNWDGVSSFYCRGRGCYNHNYYLYQHEHEPRFSLVPWDLDNTFRMVTPFDAVPMPLSVPADCSRRYSIFGSVQAKAPGCDVIFGALARVDRERYRSALRRLLAGPFDFARLDAWLDARVAQLSPHVAEDRHGPTLAAFLVSIEAFRHDLRFLAERALVEQDGGPLPSFRLALDGVNDFEATTPVGLQLGVNRQTAGGSRITGALEEHEALGGRRSLSLAFEFPASEAEERWARLRVLLEGHIVDLAGKAGVRLVLQADAPRQVRIGIDSALYAEYESRAVFGWDVALDGSRQTIELSLVDATYPERGIDAFTLEQATSQATALLIEPRVVERKNRGLADADTPDLGHIRIDDVAFTP